MIAEAASLPAWHQRWTVASTHAAIEDLCEKLREQLDAHGLTEQRFGVELVARECLNNALVHGNASDPDKRIEIELQIGPAWIHLRITDQGCGFDWRRVIGEVPDCEATCGRGLSILNLYAARIEYNSVGNRISIWIARQEARHA